MSAGISDPTRPDAARELGGLQIIDNRPLAVSLLRPDKFSRLGLLQANDAAKPVQPFAGTEHGPDLVGNADLADAGNRRLIEIEIGLHETGVLGVETERSDLAL